MLGAKSRSSLREGGSALQVLRHAHPIRLAPEVIDQVGGDGAGVAEGMIVVPLTARRGEGIRLDNLLVVGCSAVEGVYGTLRVTPRDVP